MRDPEGALAIERFAEIVLKPLSPYEDLTVEQAAVGTLAHRALGMKLASSLTKRYVVSNKMGFWLVGYVQADGLVTIHTSEGCWGYCWSYHGHETILHWLAESGLHDLDYYIPSKFAGGQKEYDAKATYRNIHQYLCKETLRIGRDYRHVAKDDLTSAEAVKKRKALEWLRHERELLRRITREWGDELPRECIGEWYAETRIDDAGEMAIYVYPYNLTKVLKSIWPAFIEAVRKDIGWQPKENRPTPTASASSSAP